jgi:hypothetical protein
MKKTILYVALAFSGYVSAQVGIGVKIPEAILDINGQVKVRTVPNTEISSVKKILVLDDNNIVSYSDITDITGIEDKITVLINKENPQLLNSLGTNTLITFSGIKEGLNSDAITFNIANNEIELPANKAIRVTGYPSLLGTKISNATTNLNISDYGNTNPGYLTSFFEFNSSTGRKLYENVGYLQSAGLKTEIGGVIYPTITFLTGESGATIKFYVNYRLMRNIPSSVPSFYLAGAATDFLPGTFLIIEEL